MNLKSKTDELLKVREELHEMVMKRGQMLGLSHQDPHWSEAKAHNYGTDVDKLQEKEQAILQEITNIKHSPEFIQELGSKQQAIISKRIKLQAELAKLKAEAYEKRGERAQAIIDGADPVKVAQVLYDQLERMEVLNLALEDLRIASTILDEIGRDVPYQIAHAENMPKNFKFDVLTEDQLRAQIR